VVDISCLLYYIYLVSVETTWTHSGPGGGTQRLHHNYTWAVGLVQVRTRKRIDLSVVLMGSK